MRSGVFWFVVFALGLGALIAFLMSRYPNAISSTMDGANLIYLVLFALIIGSSILGWRSLSRSDFYKQLGFAAKSAAAWVAIITVLVIGYSYRHEFNPLMNRLFGELAPTSPIASGPSQISVRAGANGHFHIDARVNGKRVRFLVDTGASDIVLSPADARRAGLDPKRLRYTQVYRTANGIGRGAPVTLRSLAIGPLRIRSIAASVNGAPMDVSLLGQSFLRRLKGYAVRDGVLTLDY